MRAPTSVQLRSLATLLQASWAPNVAAKRYAGRYKAIHGQMAAIAASEGVYGFGIGEKRAGGQLTGESCIRFYVRRKVHPDRVNASALIPSRIGGKTAGNHEWSISTDVVEMDEPPAAQRALLPGYEIGHVSGTSGTLGLAVTGTTGERFILSCSHVVAPTGAVQNDPIESPPDFDKEPGPNVVGTLFSYARLRTDILNQLDAALVHVPAAEHHVSNLPLRLSAPARFADLSRWNFALFRNRVVERFSPGGVSTGIIRSIENDLPFNFGPNLTLRFGNVVEVAYTSPTQGGDSGSIVVDADSREVLGLHFAGRGHIGYCILGSLIEKAFKITVVSD